MHIMPCTSLDHWNDYQKKWQKGFSRVNMLWQHNPGLWNGIWSDMYIQTTFVRYGHGSGGIVGITLNLHALKLWALSLHICSHMIKDISEMGDSCESHWVTSHKDKKHSTERGRCNG